MKKWTMIGVALVLMTAVAGTALAMPVVWGNTASGSWRDQWKYTQADYKMALSLKTEGYEAMSVGAFDKLVADWTDEDTFHQREKAFQRLTHSYPTDGEHAAFIHMTLETAFDACSAKHYGGHCTSMYPSYCDGVSRVREGDVFGYKYPVFEAEVDYTVSYQVPDEAKLTVGQRERILLAYRAAVQKYLDGRTEKELLDNEAASRNLKKELARLDKELTTGEMTLTGTSLDYYYASDVTAGEKQEVWAEG